MNPPKVTLTVKLSLIGCVLPLIRAFASCRRALCATITTREEKRSTAVSISDRSENAVKRGVNNTFSHVSRSRIKPVDINSAIRRPMDDSVKEPLPRRTIAASHFIVYAARSGLASPEADLEILADEFALQATEYAAANEYALLGPVHIDFTVDDTEQTGQLRIESSNRRDPAAPATVSPPSPAHPIISIDSEKWLLTEPVTVIGHGTEAGIVVNDSSASRRHLELRIAPTDVIAADFGSTSGTFVEGHETDAATLLDGNRIMIDRTPIDSWTHPDSNGDQ